MRIPDAIKYIETQIATLEKGSFMFDNVLLPRYEADKRILESLREQSLKLGILLEKINAKEEVSKEEIYESVPPQFR